MVNFTQGFTNWNVAHAWLSSRATSGHARHWVSAQLSDPHPWPRVCPQFAEVFHCTVHVRDALEDTHTPSGVTRNRRAPMIFPRLTPLSLRRPGEQRAPLNHHGMRPFPLGANLLAAVAATHAGRCGGANLHAGLCGPPLAPARAQASNRRPHFAPLPPVAPRLLAGNIVGTVEAAVLGCG
jgi:hypothetical protein